LKKPKSGYREKSQRKADSNHVNEAQERIATAYYETGDPEITPAPEEIRHSAASANIDRLATLR
jgi:hypothetical protein